MWMVAIVLLTLLVAYIIELLGAYSERKRRDK